MCACTWTKGMQLLLLENDVTTESNEGVMAHAETSFFLNENDVCRITFLRDIREFASFKTLSFGTHVYFFSQQKRRVGCMVGPSIVQGTDGDRK